MVLSIQPLKIHPPFLFQTIRKMGSGNIGKIAASQLLSECEPVFIKNSLWGYERIYLILMFSHYSTDMRRHTLEMNTENRWFLFFKSSYFTSLIEKHLSFQLSASELVYNVLELLFIL